MLIKSVAVISFIVFIVSGVLGQKFSKEYWEELADHSESIVVGTAEEDYMIIRPEKFKPNPDGSFPT